MKYNSYLQEFLSQLWIVFVSVFFFSGITFDMYLLFQMILIK